MIKLNNSNHLILLVEDSSTQAKLLYQCIIKMGLRPLGPATTATEALALCTSEFPALAILDVSLSDDTDGVELARQLLQQKNIPIIFASAIDNSFTMKQLQKIKPLAILLKPYSLISLQRAVELGLYGHMNTPLDWQEAAEEEDVMLTPQAPWLFVREKGLLVRVMVAEILSVQMEQKYCVLTLATGRHYLVRTPLAQMLQRLATAQFAQVHRSWLVQLKGIESVDLTAGVIKLTGNIQAPLGRAYREKLIEYLHLLD